MIKHNSTLSFDLKSCAFRTLLGLADFTWESFRHADYCHCVNVAVN